MVLSKSITALCTWVATITKGGAKGPFKIKILGLTIHLAKFVCLELGMGCVDCLLEETRSITNAKFAS